MSQMKELFSLCQRRRINVSLGWTMLEGYSLDIYTGHTDSSYKSLFKVDKYPNEEDVLEMGILFVRDLDARGVVTKAPAF